MASVQFDPSSLSKYGRLALVARNLVEGFLTGVHKSPYKGFSVEFAEHRQYYPGDEIRHIDRAPTARRIATTSRSMKRRRTSRPTFSWTPAAA